MEKLNWAILLVTVALILNSFLLGTQSESLSKMNFMTGQTIRVETNIGADGAKGSLDAEGPYSAGETFMMFCFGILILSIAYKIVTIKFFRGKNDK